MLFEQYRRNGKHKVVVMKALARQAKSSIPFGRHSTTTMGETDRLKIYANYVQDRASILLAQALFCANCYIECYEFLKEYSPKWCLNSEKFVKLKELAENAQNLEDLSRINDNDFVDHIDQCFQEQRRSGSIIPQVYPWSSSFVQRDDKALLAARTHMTDATYGKFSIRQSNTATQPTLTSLVEQQAQTLGVVANQACSTDERLFSDRTFLSGVDSHKDRCNCCRGRVVSSQVCLCEAECCDTVFCSDSCKRYSKHYHFALCTKPQNPEDDPQMSLDQSHVSPDTIAMNDLLYRLFAYFENNPAIHPLQTPIVGSMIPAYRSARGIRFSLLNDVKRPLQMLTNLGNDIYKDHGLDIWVIQTIQARIRNNVRTFEDSDGSLHVAINLLYMFFNHSCNPNVRVKVASRGSSRLLAIASRPFRSNEELFISYIDRESLSLPYDERQELLEDWTGGQCQCEKCEEERMCLLIEDDF